MSTKIYSGFYTKKDLYNFNKETFKFQEIMFQKLRKLFLKTFVDEMLFIFDEINTNNDFILNKKYLMHGAKSISLFNYMKKILEKSINSPASNSFNSLNFSYVIFPLSDKLLIIPFGSNDNILFFKEYFKLNEYGYWDNSDQPSNILDEEWEQRKRDWGEVLLNKKGIPSVDGYTKTISPDYELYSYLFWDEDYKYISEYLKNSTVERRKEYIENTLYDTIKEKLQENSIKEVKRKDILDFKLNNKLEFERFKKDIEKLSFEKIKDIGFEDLKKIELF